VLVWQLSNVLTTDFCLAAVKEAITRYPPPETFDTDQGCQFTSQEFAGLLKDHGIQVCMDGKGYWRDKGLPSNDRTQSGSPTSRTCAREKAGSILLSLWPPTPTTSSAGQQTPP
jgi:transposase InsO family protein